MKRFALAGNPNCGKTTLFNSLTGSTAHVGNWPGVTVDKKVGTYKKGSEPIEIIDLPGIYSLSPYTPEEVISRNYILEEKPDCVINIVDATNLERNLYLSTQIMEIDVPMVIALNMMDVVRKNKTSIDIAELEKRIGIKVIEISALKEENIDTLMEVAIEEANIPRKGVTVLKNSGLLCLINDIKTTLETMKVENALFHSIKLIENDEVEVNNHRELMEKVEAFKETFHDKIFGTDFEAVVADSRYKYITSYFIATVKKQDAIEKEKPTKSDKIDKVLTHKWLGIPCFLIILLLIFHLTFSEDLFFLNSIYHFANNILKWLHLSYNPNDIFSPIGSSFSGSIFEGVLWTEKGINSPGVILFNFVECICSSISGGVSSLLEEGTWYSGLIVDGVLGGLFAVLSFLPQILVLFFFFSILEDTGYMARVAFILDKLFRKFGLSGRSFMPMIMGFGCSVPAMINTRTLADDNERVATIRVIPFFSCGAKLPILTAIAGGIVQAFNIGNADIITFSMYVLGMVTAIVSVLLMRSTTMKGEVPPFIMELPTYHMPQFKSLMIHLGDKLKHFVQKAFTVILASTIVIWFLTNFGWDWKMCIIDSSILASIGKLAQPLFTPLGFGSQLTIFGWVFAVAAVTGLIAKENVVATFFTLAACIVTLLTNNPDAYAEIHIDQAIIDAIIATQEASEDGILESIAITQATGITIPGLISFIAFNMLTIPCFSAVATARAELPKNKFWSTIIFWVITSYIVSSCIYLIGTWWWTSFIIVAVAIGIGFVIHYYNKIRSQKMVR